MGSPDLDVDEDYYEILGVVSSKASPRAIREAYCAKSLQTHPDTGGYDDDFKLVCEAYIVLSDPQSRSAYDRATANPASDNLCHQRDQWSSPPRPAPETKPTFFKAEPGLDNDDLEDDHDSEHASTSSFLLKDPDDCYFANYYYSNYCEKPIVSNVRNHYDVARRK